VTKALFGFDPHTTNNRMELMAAIQGLLALKEPCEVEVTTDSEYVLHGITKWSTKWKRRHWWKKHGPVRNADLWIELDELNALHKTDWVWTRGHAGHADNARCDFLAQTAAGTQRSSWPDNRSHALLRLNLGPNYVPPKPQAGLFEAEPVDDDEEDDEAAIIES
jgi:ribonuclease HI